MGNEWKTVIAEKKSEADKWMTCKQLTDCNLAIHTASVAAAASGAIPLPGVDAVPISAAQITMVIALGKVFGQKLTESAAKGIIGATASTFLGRNLVKMIPVAGWIVSAAVAAGITEAIGWTIAVDLAKKCKYGIETADTDHIFSSVNLSDIKEVSIHDLESFGSSEEDMSASWEDSCDESTDEKEDIQIGNKKEDVDQDDESIANDISKAFEEDDE